MCRLRCRRVGCCEGGVLEPVLGLGLVAFEFRVRFGIVCLEYRLRGCFLGCLVLGSFAFLGIGYRNWIEL